MGRKGYRTEEVYTSSIFRLIPNDPQGITFEKLWKRVREVVQEGTLTRPTFSSHLRKLVDRGLILHEGKMYRINPTYDYPIGEDFRKYIEQYVGVHALDQWEEHRYGGKLNLHIERELRWRIEGIFDYIFVRYVLMLRNLVKIREKMTARELADLLIDADVRPMLMGFAHSVWKERNNVALKALDNTILRLTATSLDTFFFHSGTQTGPKLPN